MPARVFGTCILISSSVEPRGVKWNNHTPSYKNQTRELYKYRAVRVIINTCSLFASSQLSCFYGWDNREQVPSLSLLKSGGEFCMNVPSGSAQLWLLSCIIIDAALMLNLSMMAECMSLADIISGINFIAFYHKRLQCHSNDGTWILNLVLFS